MSLRSRGFTSLGPRISLLRPPQPSTGELIIVCTWLGALPKHILKYMDLYQSIAPRANVLLIESNVPILISSYKHQRDVIEPAIAAVLNCLSSSKEAHVNPKILLHSFSNGGGNSASQLLIATQERLRGPISFQGLVFDSCPAKGTYWKSYDAMVFSLPKNLASNILGPLVVHGILVLLYAWIFFGNENPASLQRRITLDKQVVGVAAKEVLGEEVFGNQGQKMTYLYSKTDKMCNWKDIRDHADDARRARCQVEEVVFEGSNHCAHLFKDPAKYTEAIQNIWSSSEIVP